MLAQWACFVACAPWLAACSKVQSSFDGGNGSESDGGSDAALPLGASCVGLAKTCGASSNDSCCNSPEVLGGTYYRSYDLAGDAMSGNTDYPAAVNDFRFDKYEVTVGRFRAFVNAGMGTQSSPPSTQTGAHKDIVGSGWDANWNVNLAANTATLIAAVKCDSTNQTWTDTPGPNEDRPMSCITWYEAMAFCVWDGGYLPTEAEWNYAATGGDQQRAYPWSNPAGSLIIDGSLASYMDGGHSLAVVGTRPPGDSRWGQSDLAGNVAEWILDWSGSYTNPCADCALLKAASNRVIRGGSFEDPASNLRVSSRFSENPMNRDSSKGVRCAKAQ